jgi:zinc protease
MLSKYLHPGLELMADSIQHPSFPAADLERVRNRRLTSLIQEQDDPVQLGFRAGALNLFGPSSPYGYDALGTTQALKAATRDDLLAFYQGHYGPRTSLLELTGDVTPAEARKLAEEIFGNWSSPATMATLPQPSEAPARKVLILDKPGAPQTALITFGLGALRNSPDYPALAVMNNMLGGLFSSRINLNLREEHGYTYGAFSFYWFYRGLGPFIAGSEVRGDVTALAAEQLFKELTEIHTKPLTDAELRMSKDAIIRSLPGIFESADGVNRQLGDLWLFGLPLDYYATLPSQIEAVTSADAQRAADKYVRPENVLLIAVGDKARIESGLQKLNLGPVTVWTETEASGK